MSIYASNISNLKQEFFISQLDRMDHPNQFSKDFICKDVDNFISEVQTQSDVYANRNGLNIFFNRMIATNLQYISVYVRLKWLAYLHKLMQTLNEKSIMFNIIIRALERYTDNTPKIFKEVTIFENYLVKTLLKPYIQYLLKLAMLGMPLKDSQQDKENKNNQDSFIRHSNLITLNTLGEKDLKTPRKSESEQESNQKDIPSWYRNYNFILQTLETFDQKLKEFEPFFQSQFPFLCNIRLFIANDLQKKLSLIKKFKISLQDLNMTIIEFNKIENRIQILSRCNEKKFSEDDGEILFSEIGDYTKEGMLGFMVSPLKARGKSLQSTLSLQDSE